MSVDTLTATPVDDTGEDVTSSVPTRRSKSTTRKGKTMELTLTVIGTADGEWHAELKHGSTWIARGLPIAAAAVSRAAKELHDDLSVPIDEVIKQQARVAALEAELEAARKSLANLAD